jgi:peptide deformylase
MAVCDILIYPDHKVALRKKSEPVHAVNHNVRRLIADLSQTLLACPEGIGLAAPQIGQHWQVVVVRLGSGGQGDETPGPPMPIINPAIIEALDHRRDFDGCLSFPGLYGQTIRPHHVRVTGLDGEGRPLDRIFCGFDAVLVHHEIDHLEGVLFIDRIDRLDDLYRIQVDEQGRRMRVPVLAEVAETLGCAFSSMDSHKKGTP